MNFFGTTRKFVKNIIVSHYECNVYVNSSFRDSNISRLKINLYLFLTEWDLTFRSAQGLCNRKTVGTPWFAPS